LRTDLKISVITVCLNAQQYIGRALRSVLSQDYPDLECVVVDGGSTDGTIGIVASMAEEDERIIWQTGPDQGIADAMNRGADRSTGQIVAYLHADDCYAVSSVISTVVTSMQQRPEAMWATGGVREIDGSGCHLREIPPRRFSHSRLLRNNVILHPATFVRRSAFEAVGGFDTDLKYAMDYDLWLRLSKTGPPVVIKQVLACFRVHPGSLSSANRLSALEEEYLVRRRYLNNRYSGWFHALYQLYRQRRENRGA
jgi:glycosyltransferase involved in cell wall biosynthesis